MDTRDHVVPEKQTTPIITLETTLTTDQSQSQQQQRQQQQQQQQQLKLTGVRNDSSSSSTATQEPNIPIASKGTRSSQKKKDPFDYMRKDDAYLAKSGLNFVMDVIDFSDDHSTISSEELRKQNIRLRGKTIR